MKTFKYFLEHGKATFESAIFNMLQMCYLVKRMI